MFQVTQSQFEELINQALDVLPQEYVSKLKNVAIVTADDPSIEQRKKLHLHNNQTLYGLCEGIPLTMRGAGYNLVVPDKITLFKNPMESSCMNLGSLQAQIKHTLWHEIAHYFGLDHDRIYRLESSQSG